MKELKLSTVRWPGGCFASGYHWKEGVGKNRKPCDDMAWGVEVTLREGVFRPGRALGVVLPDGADNADRFAAAELATSLRAEQGSEAVVVNRASSGERAIRLGRSGDTGLRPEGYRLTVARWPATR